MDKIDHLMAEKNKNNKDSQKGQVTPKKFSKKRFNPNSRFSYISSIVLLQLHSSQNKNFNNLHY
jgi:hypothetical protein